MVPRVVIFVVPAQVERAVFSTLLRAREVFRFAVVVPAKVPVPLAYMTSPRVYAVNPVPPRLTANVPVVSDTAMPRVDVADRVYPELALPTNRFPYDGAVVRPVPPYSTPMDVVADTVPAFACNGPFRDAM